MGMFKRDIVSVRFPGEGIRRNKKIQNAARNTKARKIPSMKCTKSSFSNLEIEGRLLSTGGSSLLFYGENAGTLETWSNLTRILFRDVWGSDTYIAGL